MAMYAAAALTSERSSTTVSDRLATIPDMVDGQPGPERTWAVADDGLARRLKALACTAPLHDMDARKSRLDWLEAAPYQMAEIALQIIDQVTVAMDFDHGASHDDVVRRVKTFVAAQAPQRHGEEHERVARWVLDNLINVGSVDRGFRSVYGAFDTNGEYRRLRFDFKLLIELAAGDGSVYLRASDEAINVLVGALDTDIESSQIAAEVKLENLIRRPGGCRAGALSNGPVRGNPAPQTGRHPPGCVLGRLDKRSPQSDRRSSQSH